MTTVRKRVRLGSKAAAVVAVAAGKRAARQLAQAADAMLLKLGDAARQRRRARRARAALKTAGKVALVVGAGAATAYAGKSVLARANGKRRRR
jgi:hypothetical protein